jgi:phage-related protein
LGWCQQKGIEGLPTTVQRDFGQAIFAAQAGGVDPAAKPMKGFKGVRVMEIAASYRTDTYRVIYTVNMGEYIFVLHAFQKKSKTGIKTPQKHITMVNQRLLQAKEIWQEMNQ